MAWIGILGEPGVLRNELHMRVKFEMYIARIVIIEHQPKDSSWNIAAATDAKKISAIISKFLLFLKHTQ